MSGEFAGQLTALREQGLYRSRRIIDSPQGPTVQCDGRTLLNFCSNDYLGIANHPQVVKAFQRAADRYGVGSGSAHLICGHSAAHHALEEELAEFTRRERALLFSTGYMANLGVITALADLGSTVFEDRLNHASLLDGGLMSGAKFKRYHHGDSEHLQALLQRAEGGQRLIVSDGVFSMDGDLAPLPQLAAAAAKHGACLIIDDAHGFGVLGRHGGGTAAHFGLEQQAGPVFIGTLGKAFGTFGAFVAGTEELIETLIQKARTYIYTTALPPAIAEATRTALCIVAGEEWRREKLRALTARFVRGAQQLGLPLLPSPSAIQPLVVGDSKRTLQLSESLLEKGILIGAIRPPTVPPGSARLRITFSAAHEEMHIDRLLEILATLWR
jgi:8-amino-7-oxononanoate synthase